MSEEEILSTAEGGQAQEPVSDFSIPQEYSEKGWVKNFEGKTGDELKNEIFKSFDNSQSLIGKKVSDYLANTDLSTLENYEDLKKVLSPQLVPQYQVPESLEEYALNDILKNENGEQDFYYEDGVLEYFSGEFKKNNLSVEQAQGMLKSFTDYNVELFKKETDPKALDENLNALFNNDQNAKNKNIAAIKEFLTEDEARFIDSCVPNSIIELVCKITKGFSEKYGYEESSSPGTKGGALPMSADEKVKERDRIHQQLQELTTRFHTPEEKQTLLDRLVSLNK